MLKLVRRIYKNCYGLHIHNNERPIIN